MYDVNLATIAIVFQNLHHFVLSLPNPNKNYTCSVYKLRHLYIPKPVIFIVCTGKSLSEALIFASINPQYDDRLFMALPVQYMKTTSAEHAQNMFFAFHVLIG